MILILTNKQDTHADEVIRYLSERDIRVFRLNTENILNKYDVSIEMSGDGGWQGFLVDETGRRLDLCTVRVAWFRKPEFEFETSIPMDAASAQFAASEARALIDTLYALPHITWVNDPFVASRAKVKFQQLQLASEYGIAVPATLITNRLGNAKSFFDRHRKDIITKSIYTSNVTIDGQNQGILTARIGVDDFVASHESIANCPTQLQEFVRKEFELRVTIIGDAVFSVKIDSQVCDASKVDWRRHAKILPHSIHKLPDTIREFCVRFVRSQGLAYGAIDFIVTPDGEYVFLENNPFGQYLWLELETGLPLTQTMAEYLISLESQKELSKSRA